MIIEWSGNDNDTGIDHYEIRLDEGSWTDVGADMSYTFSQLSEGSHSVEVKAVDGAGNSADDSVDFSISLEDTDGEDQADEDQSGFPWWITMIMILMVVVVLTIIYLEKKQTSEGEKLQDNREEKNPD